MTPEYQAQQDFNDVGSNCNPYHKGSSDWASYEIAFQRRWAESQGIDYGFKKAS